MRQVLLLVAGLLLIALLSFLCFINKVDSIKSTIISNVTSNLKDRQIDWVKPQIVGEGIKATEIVALSGVAPSLEKKEEAIEVAKNSSGVWGIKDYITIKKPEKKPEPIVQPVIKDVKIEKPKPKVITCQEKFEKLLSNNKINFESAKAVIQKDSFKLLSKLASVIKECPGYKIEIAGYTDSDGSNEYNLMLSAKRADAVKSYLVTHEGIYADRLEARGYGEANPIADNSTQEGKRKNRRITFKIIGEE